MQTLWFITNPGSGTTSHAKCEALEAVFSERGLTLAGRTNFPEDDLPGAAQLDRAGVDTVVLFAGDGTINAALCALAGWCGAFLILPGGTMNLLAKALHGEKDPQAIIHAATGIDRLVSLPFIEAGKHRAFVGLILGPAANWYRAREAARKRSGLIRAIRFAWAKTFASRGVRLAGAGLRDRYQAVYVTPEEPGLSVAAVEARDWRAIAELGWDWLNGDWIDARAVTETRAEKLTTLGQTPVLALFDGEPQRLDSGTEISSGVSARAFIATREEAP